MSVIRDLRGGRDHDPVVVNRMHAQGHYAELVRQRFALACRKYALSAGELLDLRCDLFQPPRAATMQLSLQL